MKVIAVASDKPLIIGGIEIPCYVLEYETRVLSQCGVLSGLNTTNGEPTVSRGSAPEIPRFASQKWLNPFISMNLSSVFKNPILFSLLRGGPAYCYPTTLLVDICNVILEADKTRNNHTPPNCPCATCIGADPGFRYCRYHWPCR